MWLLILAACGGVDDADHDGFASPEDCDDADPFVYPGAPDDPGDGIDADCAGGDTTWAFLGDWTLVEMTATYAGLYLFEDGSMGGTMQVAEDGALAMEVSGTLNPDVVGAAYPVTVSLSGTWSPIPGPDSFTLYAEGLNYDEQMHAALDCVWVEETLGCGGELKALNGSLDAEGTYVRP